MSRSHPPQRVALRFSRLLCVASRPRVQMDVISKVDEELRTAMLEAQAQVATWVTEQKHVADKVALNGQQMLAKDKGAPVCVARSSVAARIK